MASIHKEHKGRIKNWRKHIPIPEFGSEGMGYIILGTFVDHEDFAGKEGNTSWVMWHDEATGEIETLNSRYTLV